MRYKVQLVIVDDEGQEVRTQEVATLEKSGRPMEGIGISLAESKDVLRHLQQALVQDQVGRYLERTKRCACGAALKTKGHHSVVYRTLFGNIRLRSPRRRRCPCWPIQEKSASPLTHLFEGHVAPELQWVLAKCAALVPFGAAAKILKELLPVDEKLSGQSVRNQALKVARRLDEDGEPVKELHPSIGRRIRTWEQWDRWNRRRAPDRKRILPPNITMTVALDGAFIPSRENGEGHFEALVGNGVRSKGRPKCFGLVQGSGTTPYVRLYRFLKSQGIQDHHEISFVTDGEQQFEWLIGSTAPGARHILDWWHIAKRFEILKRIARGIAGRPEKYYPMIGSTIEDEIESAKRVIWQGRRQSAQFSLYETRRMARNFRGVHRSYRKLSRRLTELMGYLRRNEDHLANYAAAYRKGKRISSQLAESAVNRLVAKRFVKKQQMRWSREGAHLLLQVRAAVLNGDLEGAFKRWYPGMMAAS